MEEENNIKELIREEQQESQITEIQQILQLNILAVALLFIIVLKGGK